MTNPDWLKRPSPLDMNAVFPTEALRRGIAGSAIIGCTVTVRGALDQCHVVSEQPENIGFGAAALLLAPSFLMKPATRDGQPFPGTVRIPITFGTVGRIEPGPSMRIIQQAPFITAPSYEEVMALWPKNAPADLTDARVAMRCKVTLEGGLSNCSFTALSHPRRGFESASNNLAKKFKLNMAGATRADIANLYASVPIHFTNPKNAQPTRYITRAEWTVTADREQAAAVFPEQAAAAGLESGRSTLECTVSQTGSLDACKVASETPPGHGFGEAAMRIASVMQMRVWTEAGTPTAGARVRLPITINGREPADAAAAN